MSFVQLSGKNWGGTEYHINTKIAPEMVQFCILGNIEKTHTAQYNKTIESNGHMTG